MKESEIFLIAIGSNFAVAVLTAAAGNFFASFTGAIALAFSVFSYLRLKQREAEKV